MRLKKAIKRIVALGIGATMMGATILGATAAADLASYPSPFITGGKFDGKIVVGNDAKADDVVGSIDIATSLQYASTTSSTASTSTTTVVTGDAWKVKSGNRVLEMAENLDSGAVIKRENIRNITTYIDGSDLNALADGTVSNDKGTARYAQYLHWENNIRSSTVGSEIVFFMENDADELADYFYIKSGEQIARYEMEFKTSFESSVDDSAGAASTTGLYLSDYEGEVLNIIGMDYEVVKARRVSATTTPDSVALTLMGGATKSVMEEGETKTFTIDGKEYAVTISAITDTGTIEVKFNINGESTKGISEGNSDTLSDGTEVGVTDLMPNEAGDPTADIVEFYLGASKLYLKDTDVTGNSASSNVLEVGNEKIDDAAVIITGTNDNSTFAIDSIQINISADDDYWVPTAGKLTSLMDEPQALMNWDIEYKGLSEVAIEQIKIKTSGSDQYDLEFVDGDGNAATVPIGYTSGGTSLKLGDNDDQLIIGEHYRQRINKNDYLIITDGTQDAGQRNTFALRYKGSDKQTDDNPNVKFKNLGDGADMEKSHTRDTTSNARKATLKLGGATFNVFNASSSLADDFSVWVDLDASGSSANTTGGWQTGWPNVTITTKGGAQIELHNHTGVGATGNISVIITTPDTNDYENIAPSTLRFNLSATSGEVRMSETSLYTLLAPEDDSYTQYGYTSLGAKITFSNPASDPQELTIDYPSAEQRLPQVFVTSGLIQYSSGGGATESVTIQKIEVGAAVLASEVTNVAADNLILVGGPCANSATREVMGVAAADCASGFEEGKAKIKLYEQSSGKVALVIAGYSAMDTRRAARVIANYDTYDLSGTEVEVSGTSLNQISVSKVA